MQKICSKCSDTKNLEEFAKDAGGKFGRRSDCKICNAARTRQYQKDNPQTVLKKNRRWIKNNQIYVKKYKQNRHAIEREQVKKRYRENHDFRQFCIQSSQSYRSNPANKQTIRATRNKL